MEKLSGNERDIIRENWSIIKTNAEKNKLYENKFGKLKIKALNQGEYIELILEKKINLRVNIDKQAKIIKLKYYEKNKLKEREELIYNPKNINYLTNLYNMEHPVFQKKEKDKTLNIYADAEKSELIFRDPNITEIFDDKFELYISKKHFEEYKNKIEIKVSEYYEKPSNNKYSIQISNDESLMNQTRYNLIQFITSIDSDTKYKIIFLIGSQKIGLTFTIKKCLKVANILYINIEDLHNITKTSDRRKYLFKMFFNLFDNYSEYNNFIKKNIFELRDYDDILNVIISIINKIKSKLKNKNVTAIIDNYDDSLVDNTKLSKKYIEELYKIIQESNIHIIFLGRGRYISDLLKKYLYRPYEIENFILFNYYVSLGLNIENIIHDINRKNNINEIEEYYINKYENKEYILYNYIFIKNFPEIILESYEGEIPFQFFKIQKEDEKIKIEFQLEDLLEVNNKNIREHFSKVNSLTDFQVIKNQKLKGIIFEELISAIFFNNKSFDNIKFPQKNIIEVEEIYYMKNIIPNENIENGPILILQKKEGEVFDFGFVFNNNNIEYFIGAQVGINKTAEDILNYSSKLELNENTILSNISKLTKRTINQLRFIIILNLEAQNELKEEYDKIYSELNKAKSNTNYEKNILEEKRAKINHFNSKYGIVCCQNANITYYLFSTQDFCFYQKEKEKINIFDVEKINLVKKGFDNFCKNEYHLILIDPFKIILSELEKNLLIKSLKNILPDIEDITINHKIITQLPLLTGTPWNHGILSITKDIKLFTYFNITFTHFLIQNDHVTKYKQNEKLFDNEYNSNSILERYFVKIILKGEKKEEQEKENKSLIKVNLKEKKIKLKEEEMLYKNNLNFLQRKTKRNEDNSV